MLHRKTAKLPVPSGGFWGSVLGFLQDIGSLEERAGRSLERFKRGLRNWLVGTAVLGLSAFASLVFLVLGMFFLAIDQIGMPRGVVFICGGLLGLLILKAVFPSTKERQGE
jgi:hypothetical protein